MLDLDTLQSQPYQSSYNTSAKLAKDLKMLYQIERGEIVHIVGRLLQPFCSHATYRVQVTALTEASNDCLVIHGTLIDFQDSPVQSYAIPRHRLFRWEEITECGDLATTLSRADIERIVNEQGLSVFFRDYGKEGGQSVYVEAWMRIGVYTTKKGKKTSKVLKRSLGILPIVERMSEDALIARIAEKFPDLPREAEKSEEMV
jgi:hypothetical protein